MLKELAEVSKSSRRDRIQQRSVEQSRETPTTSLVEMIVGVPVIQTPVRTQQVVNTSDQHIIDTVEVQKPTIQEKINQVTKNIKIPQVNDIPVVVPRQILPMTQTVQKTIETPQLQCIDEAIDDLVVQVPQVQVSEKTVEISQLQTAEKIVDTRETRMIQGIQTSQAR